MLSRLWRWIVMLVKAAASFVGKLLEVEADVPVQAKVELTLSITAQPGGFYEGDTVNGAVGVSGTKVDGSGALVPVTLEDVTDLQVTVDGEPATVGEDGSFSFTANLAPAEG